MNHRQLLVLAAAVTGLTVAPVAGAYMFMSQSALGMNYSGEIANAPAAAGFQSGLGMNYSGKIANTSAAAAIVPMDAAVKTAETQAAGKAFSAELERSGSGPVYLVEFAGKGANTDVWVDAKSGKVEKTETVRLAKSAPGE